MPASLPKVEEGLNSPQCCGGGGSALSCQWPFQPQGLAGGTYGVGAPAEPQAGAGSSVLGLPWTVNEMTPRELFFIALPR